MSFTKTLCTLVAAAVIGLSGCEKDNTHKSQSNKQTNKSIITYDQFKPPIEYRKGVSPKDPKVIKHITQIEKVPDQLQKIIANEGVYIVFFNGLMTDNPEMAELKGITPRGWKKPHIWDNHRAAYDPISKGIFIGIHGDYIQKRDLSLHEYSHSFDDIIGDYFFSKSLSETNSVLEAVKKEPFFNSFPKGYLNHPREYIANSVENYYRSPETRKKLQKNHPTIFNLLSKIETKILTTNNK